MTPIDPELGDKRKNSEKSEKIQKERKVDFSSVVVSLTNDDYTLLTETMAEGANQNC